MIHWIENRANEMPNKIAIKQSDYFMTYETLLQKAKNYAYFFEQLNHKRVAFYIQNDIEHIPLILGAWLQHIEIVMINTKLSAKEIEEQLSRINVTCVLSYKTLNIKQEIVMINEIKHDTEIENIAPFDMNRIASIMFTSGTTGPAKAVPQTFLNHYYSALGCKESLGFDESTIWLSVLPIYHISGLSVLIRCLIAGFTLVLEPKFEVEKVMNIIKQGDVTHISLVPQTLQWLMNSGLNQPFNLQKILLGGAKLSDALILEALNKNLPIYNSFGMTETCSQFVTASPKMLMEEPRTVGKVPSNVKLQVINQDENGHGELTLSGGNVMNGYLTSTHPQDDFVDGFFKTGDIGSIDDNGFVFIYDRRKDLIISGGENIYPFEIEQIILRHKDIINCVAVPFDDLKWGQVPVLVYEARNEVSTNELVQLLTDNLAKYKHPKQFYRINQLPRTSTGKLSRYKVKEWVMNEKE